jgi:O-antigen/teichoic acid export membrane protein
VVASESTVDSRLPTSSSLRRGLTWASLGLLAVKVRGLLVAALIARAFGLEAYGAWVFLVTAVTYVSGLATLSLPAALVRFFPSDPSVRKVAGIVLTLTSALAAVLALPLLALSPAVAERFLGREESTGFVVAAVLLIPPSTVRLVLQDWYRGQGQMRGYAVTQTVLPALEVAAIAAVGLLGGTAPMAMGAFCAAAWLSLPLAVRRAGIPWVPTVKKEGAAHLRPYLRYAVPLVPTAIAVQIASNGDRLILGALLDPAALGLYSAAYALASLILLPMNPLHAAVFPRMAHAIGSGSPERARGEGRRALAIFAVFAVLMLAALVPFCDAVLRLILGARVEGTRPLVTTLGIGLTLFGLQRLHSLRLCLGETTVSLAAATVAAAVLNVALNLALVPRLGIVGAAHATLWAYAAALVLTVALVRQERTSASLGG